MPVDAQYSGRRHRLVIVDDSPFYRLRFARIFERSGRFSVVGTAASGEEGIALLAAERPDVVILDLVMPGIDGFGVLRWAMAHIPTPIVVCSSRRDRESVFLAHELGAVEYVTKPESPRTELRRIEEIVIERVAAAAEARLGGPGGAAAILAPDSRFPVVAVARRQAPIVAIAASTGGPAAIQRLVADLPRAFEAPIVVVQHMPPGFTRLFAERLDRLSHYTAVEAVDGIAIAPRRIHVAPGGLQTRVVRENGVARLAVGPRAPSEPHAPSADVLFSSIAEAYGDGAIAVVLTGMGNDGSQGIRTIKERGGYVLAQTAESALIYGMPRAVMATGCADGEIGLEEIARVLLALAERP
jgi:two-component system, chemotaxis family, protein-glutamate methylesterase/glutaminase